MTPAELDRFNRRAPAGTPPEDLEIDPRFGLPRWYVGGAVSPSESPLDYVGAGAAARAAGTIAKTTAAEAIATARVLRARVVGKRAAEESAEKIRKAADSIEEYLGGKPDRIITRGGGDMVVIRADKRSALILQNMELEKMHVLIFK